MRERRDAGDSTADFCGEGKTLGALAPYTHMAAGCFGSAGHRIDRKRTYIWLTTQ
jgi:hypothetical protein